MTELTAGVSTLAPDAVVVSPRDLTLVERDDLDRLRAVLTRTIDRSDPRALSWLWDRNVTDLGGRPAPAGLVEAVGAALGDVLVATVPGSRWVVFPGPDGAMPAVVAAARPGAPEMPFADTWDRWETCSRAWVIPYLSRAAAHLVSISADVRTPRVLAHDHPEITDIRGRLERLAQAQRELDALDTEAGLHAGTTPRPPVHPARAMGRVMASRGLTGRR